MITPALLVDLSPFEVTKQMAREAKTRMRTLQRQRVPASKRRVRKLTAAPDDIPALPFIWSVNPEAQARARRWYFANKVPKGSKGGRYQRTGKLEQDANVRFVSQGTGGEFQLVHNSSAWDFVYGQKQVPSHYLTGWNRDDEIIKQEAAVLSQQIREDWYFVNTGIRR